MKKIKNLKKIKLFVIWSLIIIYIFSMTFFFSGKYNKTECKAIEIKILDSSEIKLLRNEDVLEFVNKYTENKTVGYDFKTIKIYKLEEQLNKNPYIESAEVYRNASGVLKVEITQRKPILRIINKKGNSYYIDNQGIIIPFTKNYTSYQIIANGNIEGNFSFENTDSLPVLDKKENKIIYDLYTIANYINKDEFFLAQIEQIYVKGNNEFELIPRVGNHYIEFGSVENYEEKFDNLKIFYKEVLNKVGWDKYKKISLKYNNQIVGTYF